MNKKFLVAFGVMVAIIIFLVFFLFHLGDKPLKSPKPPEKVAQKTQADSKTKDKPGPTTAAAAKPGPTSAPATAAAPKPAATSAPKPTAAPAAKAPATTPATPPATSPEKPVTKHGTPEPVPPKTELQPLEPTKEYGILVRRYRGYHSAGKKMEQLKKKGLPAFIRRDKGRYEVWVGPFATPQEAQKAARTIKGKRRRPPKVQKITIPVPK